MDWQLLVVFAAIAWALWVVARRVRMVVRGANAGCGSCAKCPQSEPSPGADFVPLDVSQIRR